MNSVAPRHAAGDPLPAGARSVPASRQHTSAYVSIRQHTSAYAAPLPAGARSVPAWRQHTSAYVSIRQHTPAYVSIRQHTPAYASTWRSAQYASVASGRSGCSKSTRSYSARARGRSRTRATLFSWSGSRVLCLHSIRQHTSAYVIAYVSICRQVADESNALLVVRVTRVVPASA